MSNGELQNFRDAIDQVDNDIIRLLGERFRITRKVGLYKQAHGLRPVDPDREAAKILQIREQAEQNELDPNLAEQLFRLVMGQVVREHKTIQS